jgi:hypothetical protein
VIARLVNNSFGGCMIRQLNDIGNETHSDATAFATTVPAMAHDLRLGRCCSNHRTSPGKTLSPTAMWSCLNCGSGKYSPGTLYLRHNYRPCSSDRRTIAFVGVKSLGSLGARNRCEFISGANLLLQRVFLGSASYCRRF